MDISSVIKDIDFGLVVAILSLAFTGIVSFITIRYTKRSLDYTKKSVQIADASLKASQKSIDTSIEIYEKQKKDDDYKKDHFNSAKSNAIKTVLTYRLSKAYMNQVQMIKTFRLINKHSDALIILDDLGSGDFFAHSPNGGSMFFSYKLTSICDDFEMLYEINMLDNTLGVKLININDLIIGFSDSIGTLICILKQCQQNEIKIEQVRSFFVKFEKQFIDYKERIEELFLLCSKTGNSIEDIYNNVVVKK